MLSSAPIHLLSSLVIAASMAAFTPPVQAIAQTAPVATTAQEKAEREERLREVNRVLRETRARREKLNKEMADLGKDIGSINRVLVETTRRAQALEGAVAETETRLEQLGEKEEAILVPLNRKRGVMMEVLAALQRVGENPPPALLISPDDALSSVHSALLLGAVVPQLREQSASLRLELRALSVTRASIDTHKAQLAEQLNDLAEDEERLTRLVAEKEAIIDETQAQANADAKAVKDLAAEAETLSDLIAGLDSALDDAARTAEAARTADAERQREEAARLAKAREALARQSPGDRPGMLSAALDPARQEPAIPFARAEGLLPRPVQGVELYDFGAPLPTGPRRALEPAPNIAITTRPNARVRAPADGWVIYAGPFRSYGTVLILNAGGGYNIVLSGLRQADVLPGRFVVAGEPVGRMSARRTARATVIGQGVASLGGDRPVLYVEFRKDGKPVNPAPWWSNTGDVNLAAASAGANLE